MSQTQILVLGGFLIGAVVYPLAMRGLAVWARPYRMRMADLAHDLSRSSHLTPDQRSFVIALAQDAFDWRYMLIAAFLVPPLFMRRVIRRAVVGGGAPTSILDGAEQEKLREFNACHNVATAAANPLFALVVGLELIPFVVLYALRFRPEIKGEKSRERAFQVSASMVNAAVHGRFKHS